MPRSLHNGLPNFSVSRDFPNPEGLPVRVDGCSGRCFLVHSFGCGKCFYGGAQIGRHIRLYYVHLFRRERQLMKCLLSSERGEVGPRSVASKQDSVNAYLSDPRHNELLFLSPISNTSDSGDIKIEVCNAFVMTCYRFDEDGQSLIRCRVIIAARPREMCDLHANVGCVRKDLRKENHRFFLPIRSLSINTGM